MSLNWVSFFLVYTALMLRPLSIVKSQQLLRFHVLICKFSVIFDCIGVMLSMSGCICA